MTDGAYVFPSPRGGEGHAMITQLVTRPGITTLLSSQNKGGCLI